MGDKVPTGQERIKLLYEEYIHYSWLKQVWDEPLTNKPELEPCCAAAFHGIELAFLLMAEFITDKRTYVAKRPRIEAMALDIRAQMQLLGEIVDGELEEEGQSRWASLTQDFPFEGCPPTTTAPACSPGLTRLIEAVRSVQGHISTPELNSVIKVTLKVTNAFQAAFQRWTVGLGIEHQFNTLLQLLGLKHRVLERETNLDYMAMFRPQVVEATLTHETYENDEDFFFRTIHLGTECWMFVANSRARSAAAYAQKGDWQIASARIMQAAHILQYLGDHIMTLTRMNLRDYLQLKVQLEGTSGAGSSQVRGIRGLVMDLMLPLSREARHLAATAAVTTTSGSASHSTATGEAGAQLTGTAATNGGGANGGHASPATASVGAAGDEDAALLQGIMTIYISCERYPGLYNYAKALEDLESALLGGFFYKHYCLAANVIGSEARGTMRRAVGGLKSGYEKPVFPVLDAARCALGFRYDQELSHLKGKMMDEIMARYATTSGTRKEREQAMIPMAVVSAAAATAVIESIATVTSNSGTETDITSPAGSNRSQCPFMTGAPGNGNPSTPLSAVRTRSHGGETLAADSPGCPFFHDASATAEAPGTPGRASSDGVDSCLPALQRLFLEGLTELEAEAALGHRQPPVLSTGQLELSVNETETANDTLVFKFLNVEQATDAVARIASRGVAVEHLKDTVHVGFGVNRNVMDVKELLKAVRR